MKRHCVHCKTTSPGGTKACAACGRDFTSYRAKLHYQFDKKMERGTPALVALLSIATTLFVIFAAVVRALTRVESGSGQPLSLSEGFWASLMRTLDPGTMGHDTGWSFRLVMLLVTVTGIFVVSTLTGVLSTGIHAQTERLRKGHSLVLERGHTIIFNWSPSIFDVISELVEGHEGKRALRVVIMSNRNKVAMEDDVKQNISNFKNTRIICRSGDPTDLSSIRIVNPTEARSIIILSPQETGKPYQTADCEGYQTADYRVIKTMIALAHDAKTHHETTNYLHKVVAEIREVKSEEIAREVGQKKTQLVLTDKLISQIIVQSCRHPGLSVIYEKLLDQKGTEIYTICHQQLAGKRFAEALDHYPTNSLIGLCGRDGTVSLNPPMDTIISATAKAVVIAPNLLSIKTGGPIRVEDIAQMPRTNNNVRPEKTLLLGWSSKGPLIVKELSKYANADSTLIIAADQAVAKKTPFEALTRTDKLSVKFENIDTTSRSQLQRLKVEEFDHIVVLGYSNDLSQQETDTRTLITLFHLRDLLDVAKRRVRIVSEMVDARNRQLADISGIDDFAISNKFIGLMLAQYSKNPDSGAAFKDLLNERGSEICFRPASDYVQLNVPVLFQSVVAAARSCGEIAIGHHLSANDRGTVLDIILNPAKSSVQTYSSADRVILLARQ